jgi:hypothetical protein
MGLSVHADASSSRFSNSNLVAALYIVFKQRCAADLRDTAHREKFGRGGLESPRLRRNRGRIPLRLAAIAEPLLIMAVSQGLTNPLGREGPGPRCS